MTKSASNSYIRFLNALDAIAHINPHASLDAIETQLLEYVLIANHRNQEVLVGDLLKLSQLGSQATLHSRIKSLAVNGYVDLRTDKVDGRRKFVEPTKKAIKYLQLMSEQLQKATR